MAIPFFEPKNTEANIDQVDGHNSHPPAPAMTVPHAAPAATTPAVTNNMNGPPTNIDETEIEVEQLQAWKILALAMCKALKEYYEKTASSSQQTFTTAVVQILPNGHMQPMWK